MRHFKRFGHVTFLSTRIAGTDGVSLETKKWAEVLRRMGLDCSFIAGECDEAPDRTVQIETAHFNHPEIKAITDEAFSHRTRSESLARRIVDATEQLRQQLFAALRHLDPDVLIVENALTIPMNLPLGLAVIQVLQQKGLACIAHHHDFVWERERFLLNAVEDYLAAAFPPPLDAIQHVAINRQAAREFSRRTGLSCRVIPNVMDFDHPPDPPDEFAQSFRSEIGLSHDAIMLLQPTRIVPRKAIERSIELARRLRDPRITLVISHEAGDEGSEYLEYLNEYGDLMEVPVIFAADRIGDRRYVRDDGRQIFCMSDVYPQADLVTYPSTYEGFGNAFLEAIYYRRPIVSNRYAIYRTDLEPCGVRPILFDGFLSEKTVESVRRVLADADFRREMTDHNYEIGQRYFSFDLLHRELHAILHRLEASTC